MKKRKAKCLLAIMFLSVAMSIGMSAKVEASGCSDYFLYEKGKARCTNHLCPGGFKRRERQDHYRRTCVRDDGGIYHEDKFKDVFISCDCL